MNRSGQPGVQRGFTLLELATTMAIVLVLLSISGIGMLWLIRQHQLTTTVNEFFSAIQLARSEAIQRGRRVDIVPAGEGIDWRDGWTVFIDGNANLRPDPDERIVFMRGPVKQDMQIQSRFTDSSRLYLSYNAAGRSRTNTNSQSPQSGTVVFTLGEQAREIRSNFLGRPRACNPAQPGSC